MFTKIPGNYFYLKKPFIVTPRRTPSQVVPIYNYDKKKLKRFFFLINLFTMYTFKTLKYAAEKVLSNFLFILHYHNQIQKQ